MKLYKLTEQNLTTYNNSMNWEINKTNKSNKIKKCKDPQLCTDQVIHAYTNKNLALLLNPIHAHIVDPILFECEGEVVVSSWDKCGTFELTPLKRLQYPRWYRDEGTRKDVQVLFAIYCAESVLSVYEEKYTDDSRPRKAIEAARNWLEFKTDDAAANAAYYAAAADADAADAAYAAAYAVNAAKAAANAAYYAAADAYAAAAAAHAARAAARAAAHAAHANAACYAADDNKKISFSKLANKAIKTIMEKK